MIESEPTAASDGPLTSPDARLADLERRITKLESILLAQDTERRRTEAVNFWLTARTATGLAEQALGMARVKLSKMIEQNFGTEQQRADAQCAIGLREAELARAVAREAAARIAKDALYPNEKE